MHYICTLHALYMHSAYTLYTLYTRIHSIYTLYALYKHSMYPYTYTYTYTCICYYIGLFDQRGVRPLRLNVGYKDEPHALPQRASHSASSRGHL